MSKEETQEDEQKVWDDFFCTLVGWTTHPGYYRDNATKPTLEQCAAKADEMLEIRCDRMLKAQGINLDAD